MNLNGYRRVGRAPAESAGLTAALLASLMLLLSGCGGKRIAQLEGRVASNEEAIKDMRTIQADYSVSLENLRGEMRRLSGMVEELEYLSRGKAAELQKTLERFSTRVPPPPGVPEELLVEDEEQLASNTSESAERFKTGLQKLRAGDFSGAAEEFSQFVQANPNTIFTDNALLWIGIAQEKLGQYDQAILSFSEVFEQYPGEDRAPWGLLRLASVFAKIGQVEDARLTYQKVIDDYPRSPAAKKAAEEMRELKRGRR